MVRPSPVITLPLNRIGAKVAPLAAVHRCVRVDGTAAAAVVLGAGEAAGRLIVARSELRHQNIAMTVSTTAAIAAAAMRSALVRRSGRII